MCKALQKQHCSGFLKDDTPPTVLTPPFYAEKLSTHPTLSPTSLKELR